MRPNEIDHIDPKWGEGRDYMLVCGLNVACNYAEREWQVNASKGNRFLTWRNAREEIGVDPVDPGDLCLFLDPDTNEWVLEEFMGVWWFEKSFRYSSGHNSRGWRQTKEGRERISRAGRGRKMNKQQRLALIRELRGRTHSEETKDKMSKASKGKPKSEEHKLSLQKSRAKREVKKRLRMIARVDPLTADFED